MSSISNEVIDLVSDEDSREIKNGGNEDLRKDTKIAKAIT